MIDPIEFRNEVISPALDFIGLNSDSAQQLLLGTAVQESRLKYFKQINGPARSFYQLEPATVMDITQNYLVRKYELKDKVEKIRWGIHLETELMNNLFYATIMARLVYYRVPEPLPDTLHGMASYWKRHYNTHRGKGTEEEFIKNYERYVEGIR